ncbi:MAG: AraC family transcriptional regulator [Clostridia bacterium]|nr:AraC family transcriptional regulator [Clostridia bacterium]
MDRNLLKENRVHGDVMYPLSVYHMDCSSQHILDCHWHDELEFLIVTAGKATFQIGTSYYDLSAGQAVFVNSGDLHAGYPLDHSHCSYSAVVFSPDLLFSAGHDMLQEKYITPFTQRKLETASCLKGDTLWEKEVLKWIEEIFVINLEKTYAYELETKARLYLILSRLLADSKSAGQVSPYSRNDYKAERLKTVLDYIQTHYPNKIHLKDLASIISMSEGHFCRFFKQMLKKTPFDYLNHYRIQKAAKLLESSNKKIYEISLDVGFDNFSYFINIFKVHMGCTPSQYRQKNLFPS